MLLLCLSAGLILPLAYILPFLPGFSQPPALRRRDLLLAGAGMAVWTVALRARGLPGIALVRFTGLGALLTLAALYDMKARIIPNRLIAWIGAAGTLWVILCERDQIGYLSLSALIAFGFTLLSAVVGRGALGAGDVKLISAVAFLAGLKDAALICFLGLLALLPFGLYHTLLGKGLGHRLPLAPFLWAGGVLVLAGKAIMAF